jgi:hypothetical protein
MKNIETILSENGVELTDEQKKAISKAVGENYKTVADWQKQHDKVQTLEEQLSSTKEALSKFDGVDADGLNNQIAALKADLEKKDAEYQTQIADRDFNDMLKDSIASVNGRNAKAITALLDVDALKASKNQKEDIANALKALTEAEDSKMLFGESEPVQTGMGAPIGVVTNKNNSDADYLSLRSAFGLPDENPK